MTSARGAVAVLQAVPPANRWIAVLALVWGVVFLPYTMVGVYDLEEYFTSVATTRVAMNAMLSGAWPFWSLDFGLGAPQPLRFHFITHPLAPLCAVTDCHALLRSIASLHVLLGALCIGLLTLRITGRQLLAGAAGVTYCLSSSVVQPMFIDDWPLTAINESALPVLIYAALAIGDSRHWRGALFWCLVLGWTGGLILSTSFPVVTLVIVALVSLSAPGLRRRFPWLVVAGLVTTVMGAAQVYQLYEQFALTPATVIRRDHPDSQFGALLWSTFARPLIAGESNTWRTAFFGPPFAIAAVWAALVSRVPDVRPLRVGLLLGIAGLIVPPAWLLSINTAQWTYRTELNVFGILLGAYGIHLWTQGPGRRRWAGPLVALQLACVAGAAVPVWRMLPARALGLAVDLRPDWTASTGVAGAIAAQHAERPGRVAFSPRTDPRAPRRPDDWRADPRQPRGPGDSVGVAPNQMQILGVPSVSAMLYGLTIDALYPTDYMLESETRLPEGMLTQQASLDALGIRYVVALDDEAVAPGLRAIRRLTDRVRLYENPTAWPDAVVVDALPQAPVPRLPGCAHGRFLCADFSRYDLSRQPEPLAIVRLGDGLRLRFAPAASVRSILITQWYQPGWVVTEGKASVTRVAEQLVGVRVEPGEQAVTVRFWPPVRGPLFVIGVTVELAIAAALAGLAIAGAARL